MSRGGAAGAALAASLLVACGAPVPTADDTDAVDSDVPVADGYVDEVLALVGDATRGAGVYTTVAECADCHGADGDGRLLDAELDLRVVLPDLTDAQVVGVVADGVDDTLMVGFRGFLSRQEMADLLAYLRTLGE